MVRLKPLFDHVLLSAIDPPDKVGSIILSETAKENRTLITRKYKVIAVGAGDWTRDGSARIPVGVKPGDIVYLTDYAETDIAIDGVEYTMVRGEQIMGVLNG